jgi:class 3 adenylate cyclase
LAAGLARTSWLQTFENFYTDTWHVLAGVRHVPQHTAIVAVDDATLLALKDVPLSFWGPQFGLAMERLERVGVKVVGLDILFQVSAESWLKKLELPDSEVARNYDSPLRAALSRGNKVLIAHLVEQEGDDLRLLTPSEDQLLLLPGGVNDLGIANLHPDDDKHVRRFYPVLLPDRSLPGIGFATQLALRAAGQDPTQAVWELGGERIARELKSHPIGFAGPPGTIPTVSMNVLLGPDALANPKVRALKDKVVIIGANNAGTPDRHFTPYSRGARSEQMAGAEIHANIVETLLTGRYPRGLSLLAELVYVALILALATVAYFRLSVVRGAVLAVAGGVGIAFAAYVAFGFNWMLPVAGLQLGVIAAFLMSLGLRLTGEERERTRIRQIFGRYVSDEVVTKLLSENHRPDLGGEALNVTVLFSDIRGFTSISEKLTAHEVVEMLNAYFTRACEPILAQGGTVDKYIGDAVMAVFGSPVQYPDHAQRAIRAALGMAREAEGFKQWMRKRFPDRGLSEFAIGVGLHTGEAVIGDIGTPKRKEFTAIGDTVNAASRLEGLTKDLQCVIVASDATVKSAGEGVKTGRCEELKVKGKADAMRVCEIVGFEGE